MSLRSSNYNPASKQMICAPITEIARICRDRSGQVAEAGGASRYVFCVNVDAVIAAMLLAVLWNDDRAGTLTDKNLETAAFNVFLYGRMIGAAAGIDEHLNRGRDTDTRTPVDQCGFVV